MGALAVAFAVVFLAEFGDKTELLTLTLAARFGAAPVLAGVTLTTTAMNALSVTLGVGLAREVPSRLVAVVAGGAFLGFAVWSGRGRDANLDLAGHASNRAIVLRSAGLFAASEVGDKTMLATIALAARGPAGLVWGGSTLGVVAAETMAVLAGVRIGKWVSRPVLQAGSAIVFAGMGVALLARAAL